MGVAGLEELWTIMPFVDQWEMTKRAAEDVLKQEGEGVRCRLLLIDNGGSWETRRAAEAWAEANRVLLWSHHPPLPSLAATWNKALDAVWGMGGERAWVCNNDIRLAKETAALLLRAQTATGALFVSAVGVDDEAFGKTLAQWKRENILGAEVKADYYASAKGGPDFSCYIITKECHSRYWFDENFVPAYCEDLDYHRRLMLGGDGRRIFSVNVPFLHVDRGSGTLKGMDEGRRRRLEEAINAGSRAYYARKWGGGVNEEKWTIPFKPALHGGPHIIDGFEPEPRGATTPELQEATWHDADAAPKTSG